MENLKQRKQRVDEPEAAYRKRIAPSLAVLDRTYAIVSIEDRFTQLLAEGGWGICGLRLPDLIERRVRLSIRTAGDADGGGVEFLSPNLLIRAVQLDGPAGSCVVVSIERHRDRDPIADAAVRFQLTRRETEILTLVISGLKGREIAERTHIQPNTVREHFKNVARKIGARSRAEMIAKIFH